MSQINSHVQLHRRLETTMAFAKPRGVAVQTVTGVPRAVFPRQTLFSITEMFTLLQQEEELNIFQPETYENIKLVKSSRWHRE